MSGEELFMLFYTHPYLRQSLCFTVRRFSTSCLCQQELLQAAWIAIAESRAGETDDCYFGLAYRACNRVYKIKYRYHPKRVDSTERAKTCRRKKYLLKVQRKIV